MQGAHAVLVLTEWDEFARLDFQRVYASMQKPAFIFDGRNLLNHDKLQRIGFETFSIGKAAAAPEQAELLRRRLREALMPQCEAAVREALAPQIASYEAARLGAKKESKQRAAEDILHEQRNRIRSWLATQASKMKIRDVYANPAAMPDGTLYRRFKEAHERARYRR